MGYFQLGHRPPISLPLLCRLIMSASHCFPRPHSSTTYLLSCYFSIFHRRMASTTAAVSTAMPTCQHIGP